MLVTPPCGASSNIALWRAKIKPPVELVVGDLAINWLIYRDQNESASVYGQAGGVEWAVI